MLRFANRDLFMLNRGGGPGHSLSIDSQRANDIAPNLYKRAGYDPRNEDNDTMVEDDVEDTGLESQNYVFEYVETPPDIDEEENYAGISDREEVED